MIDFLSSSRAEPREQRNLIDGQTSGDIEMLNGQVVYSAAVGGIPALDCVCCLACESPTRMRTRRRNAMDTAMRLFVCCLSLSSGELRGLRRRKNEITFLALAFFQQQQQQQICQDRHEMIFFQQIWPGRERAWHLFASRDT